MALYQYDGTTWVLCNRPYVKVNGVWTASDAAYMRIGGTWQQAYDYDVTPPDPPVISLSVAEDFDTVKGQKKLSTRYIKVGIRLPPVANDPDVRLVRVLTTYNGKPPTTQFGGTYTSGSDHNYPNEPWSEWRYNDYGGHKDTSVVVSKQWKPNYASGDVIPSDTTYYFTGWTLDNSGNWSASTPASIHVPKASQDMPNVITKEARIQPNSSGQWRTNGFHGGDLIQQSSPRSIGLWLYGNQISDTIGQQGTPTIKSAQIYIKRRTNDTGQANANLYLFWTDNGTVGGLPAAGTSIGRTEVTKLGTLAKGQGKWFNIPETYYNNMNSGIKGMGLDNKDPIKADAFPADFSTIVGVADNVRCGELHIVWEETL